MQAALHHDITQRLQRDYEFKSQGEWLRKGRCPQCSKKELYTHAEHPWVLRCPRANNCGWLGNVKDLYPEIFRSWSDRFQATPEDPNAAATAYLQMARGLNTAALGDCYSQGTFYSHELRQGSATVKFTLSNGSTWERLIDQPERFGNQKANFRGGYKGIWWVPPTTDFTQVKKLWLVEGIFDALTLRQRGITAVSLMSSNNYPEQSLDELAKQHGQTIELVFAFDTDNAGSKSLPKMVKRAREAGWICTAAQIPQRRGKKRLDWNDLHLMPDNEFSPEKIADYMHHGAILLADSAAEKALLLYKKNYRSEFWFFFRSQMFWYKFDEKKYRKAFEEIRESIRDGDSMTDDEVREKALLNSGALSQISTCAPTLLYFQRNAVTDESWFFTHIDLPHHPSVKTTFTASQLASAPEFKKRLMHVSAGGHYSGDTMQLDVWIKDQQRHLKTVETIDFIGYTREHGCWIFDGYAVKDGHCVKINDEDFFDFGKLSIKSLITSIGLKPNPNAEDYSNDWLEVLWKVYGVRGLIALTFWFGSLFAEQIRATYEAFPFLEMTGEAGAGKTTLVKFLWKLMGRPNYEGFDPSKSSAAGRMRNFAQVAGLPIVLMESDRTDGANQSKYKAFDWDELKSFFNGGTIRDLGVKNAGNDTYAPPFRASIVIEQNAPVNASEAVLSRIVYMHFDKAGHTLEGNKLSKKLVNWPANKLSHFIIAATCKERQILDMLAERLPHFTTWLQQEHRLKEFRIIQTHGLLMALLDSLALVVPEITEDMKREVQAALHGMAIARQQAISADHPVVQEFWEAFDYLDSLKEGRGLNHSRTEGEIAINLNHFIEEAMAHRQQVPTLTDLKRHLKGSRTRKFVESARVVNSSLFIKPGGDGHGQSVRCWIFKAEGKAK